MTRPTVLLLEGMRGLVTLQTPSLEFFENNQFPVFPGSRDMALRTLGAAVFARQLKAGLVMVKGLSRDYGETLCGVTVLASVCPTAPMGILVAGQAFWR